MILVDRGQYWNDAEMRDLVGDSRPLVDAPRTLHEERLGRDARDRLGRCAGRGSLHEGEETLLPRHQLEDDGLDLKPYVPLQLAPRQAPGLHEQLAESLAVRSALLRGPGSLQIALGDLPRAHQHPAERMRVRANRRGHDAPGLEAHHALVVA